MKRSCGQEALINPQPEPRGHLKVSILVPEVILIILTFVFVPIITIPALIVLREDGMKNT